MQQALLHTRSSESRIVAWAADVLWPCCFVSAQTACFSGSPSLQARPGGRPVKTTTTADFLEWRSRRIKALPPKRMGVPYPYQRRKEPKPWTVVHEAIVQHAARHRPEKSRRLQWDRDLQRRLQIAVRSPADTVAACAGQRLWGIVWPRSGGKACV